MQQSGYHPRGSGGDCVNCNATRCPIGAALHFKGFTCPAAAVTARRVKREAGADLRSHAGAASATVGEKTRLKTTA